MKHLNPRQGITTEMSHQFQVDDWVDWCETPKSPPGDYNRTCRDFLLDEQPLTGVKHLNPRQGITTGSYTLLKLRRHQKCETPKSPPGDYNILHAANAVAVENDV